MIVIASREGRIGNSLFTFAHFLALAKEIESPVANPVLEEYASELEEFHDRLWVAWPSARSFGPRTPSSRKALARGVNGMAALLARRPLSKVATVKRLTWGQAQNMEDPEFLAEITSRRLVFVQGWLFYCDNYLQSHKDFVIDMLRPRNHWLEGAELRLRSSRRATECLVGVHVRRTDYRNFMQGKYYWSRDEYENLLGLISDLYGNRTRFLLTTDDPIAREWSFPQFDVTISNSHFMEDLVLLSGCDRIVGPPSTFSMWASFAGDVPIWFADPSRTVVRENEFRVARSHTEFPGAEDIIAGRRVEGWPWGPSEEPTV